uniref:Uncharacterized protein n=1 Tax=Hemiselmis tepida TaxID=464990 RepID=A0A7S0W1W2_9CRYP|mmetsp:Transcript_37147/g.94892  ORF Transcript_37147/g.94892 Transcript_37147/m.94892 type:complete len:183 (+) Transcript_37147:144-692(+)
MGVLRSASLLLSVSLAILCETAAFSAQPVRTLQMRSRARGCRAPLLRMQDGGRGKGSDESWRDKSDEYDGGGLSETPQPPPYSKPMAQDYEWLRGRKGGLFDEDTRGGRAPDPIRQQEWNAVNRFSSESGFILAGIGIVLLVMVYTSIYNSGGMDGSRRYAPVASNYQEGCDLESDPDCRYQ